MGMMPSKPHWYLLVSSFALIWKPWKRIERSILNDIRLSTETLAYAPLSITNSAKEVSHSLVGAIEGQMPSLSLLGPIHTHPYLQSAHSHWHCFKNPTLFSTLQTIKTSWAFVKLEAATTQQWWLGPGDCQPQMGGPTIPSPPHLAGYEAPSMKKLTMLGTYCP